MIDPRKDKRIVNLFTRGSHHRNLNVKRKIDLVEEDQESEHEKSESSGDESEDEEPRIKGVLSHLSQAVSETRDSELLHSMAASKDVLFWTPRGQLLRNKRIIFVTNFADLVEYVLLPHNNEVTKPRALNTFLDGLAELGIDNGLIKHKKLLSDLIEKENSYRNAENTSENESNYEEISLDTEEEGRRKKKRKWLLRKVLKITPKRTTRTLKTTVRKQKVVARKRPPPFTLKVHVNFARTLMCTGH